MLFPAELAGGLRYLPVDPVLRTKDQHAWNPEPKWPLGAAVILVAGAIAYAANLNRRRVS
jgi:hypothetical protein